METNYNSNRVHIFALILSQLTSNYQCDLDPALIQISRLKIKIRIKTVNIWKVWRILLPTVVYDHRRLTEICRTFPKGRCVLEVTITDSQRLRATPYIDLKYFWSHLPNFLTVVWLFYLNKRLAIPKTVHDDVVNSKSSVSNWMIIVAKLANFAGWLASPRRLLASKLWPSRPTH